MHRLREGDDPSSDVGGPIQERRVPVALGLLEPPVGGQAVAKKPPLGIRQNPLLAPPHHHDRHTESAEILGREQMLGTNPMEQLAHGGTPEPDPRP